MHYDAYKQTNIDVEFANWSTSNMMIKGEGLFTANILSYNGNDGNTYNWCKVLQRPINVQPGHDSIITYNQGDYGVNFSNQYSYLVDTLSFRDMNYIFSVNNQKHSDPKLISTSHYSKAVKSFTKMANRKSDPKAVEKFEHMQKVNK